MNDIAQLTRTQIDAVLFAGRRDRILGSALELFCQRGKLCGWKASVKMIGAQTDLGLEFRPTLLDCLDWTRRNS